MKQNVFLRSLTLQNFLSFGNTPTKVELGSLNVLIGTNGSGKSNLIAALGLLQNTPKELSQTIGNGGSIDEWLWKGAKGAPTALLEAVIGWPEHVSDGHQPWRLSQSLEYSLAFTKDGFRFAITREQLRSLFQSAPDMAPELHFRVENGSTLLMHNGSRVDFPLTETSSQRSILSRLRDPVRYQAVTHVADFFAGIRLYRDWEFGDASAIRDPCDPSLPSDSVEEDFSNFALVLGRLLSQPEVKEQILRWLQIFYSSAQDLRTSIAGGRVQTWLEERGLRGTVPLKRMSDGTIRWLALLTILLDPQPPPLICIEEPELGLHPDIIPEVAELLRHASHRTQLILTTQSDRLVSEFSKSPETVIVCEKVEGASDFRRLDANSLAEWLEVYSLGQLWTKGEIGGTRW